MGSQKKNYLENMLLEKELKEHTIKKNKIIQFSVQHKGERHQIWFSKDVDIVCLILPASSKFKF